MELNLEEQKQRFLDICRSTIHRDGLDSLLDWLCKVDFFQAPSSTKYHRAYAGGLCQHSLDVYDYAKKLTFLSPAPIDGEEKRITSNIFSVELDAKKISAKQFIVSLVDNHGKVNSDQIEVCISNKAKVKQIKIQLQLKAGVSNGRFYIVVSDSKGEKNFYSEPICVDIAFAIDDEFVF